MTRLPAPWLALAAATVLGAAPAQVRAGPPYVTDDPEPTDPGHWEIYNFATGSQTPGDLAGEAGLDINYGAAPNVQATAVVPVAFDNGDRLGAGVLQLAIKYRLLRQQPGSWMPDVSFFPRVLLPTGVGFDPTPTGLFLPLWAEKDFGPWSVFGGGGLQLNPGPQQRNFWQSGIAISRALGERASIGVEVFQQTASARGQQDFAGVNVGATYKLSAHWTLMGAAGPGVENARREDQYMFYAALEATY